MWINNTNLLMKNNFCCVIQIPFSIYCTKTYAIDNYTQGSMNVPVKVYSLTRKCIAKRQT